MLCSEVPMDHETQAKQKTMKNVMRGLAALMVPLTASFPVAIFAYWIPSNIFTFLQVRAYITSPPPLLCFNI